MAARPPEPRPHARPGSRAALTTPHAPAAARGPPRRPQPRRLHRHQRRRPTSWACTSARQTPCAPVRDFYDRQLRRVHGGGEKWGEGRRARPQRLGIGVHVATLSGRSATAGCRVPSCMSWPETPAKCSGGASHSYTPRSAPPPTQPPTIVTAPARSCLVQPRRSWAAARSCSCTDRSSCGVGGRHRTLGTTTRGDTSDQGVRHCRNAPRPRRFRCSWCRVGADSVALPALLTPAVGPPSGPLAMGSCHQPPIPSRGHPQPKS
jgi:hypothetical protein